MNFDDLLRRYFDTSDLSEVSPAMLEAGTDRFTLTWAWKRIVSASLRFGLFCTCLGMLLT